jgi:hypothetical protein
MMTNEKKFKRAKTNNDLSERNKRRLVKRIQDKLERKSWEVIRKATPEPSRQQQLKARRRSSVSV